MRRAVILWEIPKNCPVCGRFLKKTVEGPLGAHEGDPGWIRTTYTCTNTKVDHDDWD